MKKKNKKVKKKVLLIIIIILIVAMAIGVTSIILLDKDNKITNTIPNLITTESPDKDYTYSTTIDELETYYLALDGKKTLEITYNTSDDYDNTIDWKIADDSIISIDENNCIRGLKTGTTTLTGTLKNGFQRVYEIMVTDLIIPMKVDYNKTVLPCNRYTEEEAELLDKILASRVQEGGEGSRGGVLAAARFLVLEFPYKIKYFNENGRLVDNGIRPHVDGEGRYYHKGLYLSESKFATLEAGATRQGPAIWGCNLYDEYVSRSHANGFTCSGFVTWAMYNGGFDVGDVGAGNSGYSTDLWNLGEHHEITLEYMKGNTYKVGDFIARDGHAALIIGISEDSIYTAEALPRPNHNDVSVYGYGRYDNTTIQSGNNKKGIVVDENLTYVVEMSDIYPNGDGWTTDMWES
jgi:hypothetical protein